METNLSIARVKKVILDKNDDKAKRLGLGSDAVGLIQYSFLDESTDYQYDLPIAKPLFSFLRVYPVKDEIVYILKGPNESYNDNGSRMDYYLPPISVYNSPTHNSFPTNFKLDSPPIKPSEAEAGATNKEEIPHIDLGDYFRELEFIRPLLPYEGDTILEGRYGNSIRFGGTVDNLNVNKPNRWSNEGEVGNPITIIRNGQVGNEQEENYDHILEDVAGDDSSIYLCSQQQLTDFIPASLNQLSFGQNLMENKSTEEPTSVNDDKQMPSDVTEDVVLNSPKNIPAEELQKQDELANLTDSEIAYYDIGETEGDEHIQNIIDNNINIPSTYNLPTDGSMDLDEKLG